MATVSRVLGISTIAVLGAPVLFLFGSTALSPFVRDAWRSHGGTISPSTELLSVAPIPVIQRNTITVRPQARNASIKVKTRVLLVSNSILDRQHITYNITVPAHHVRPDSADTENGAVVLDDATLNHLLYDAQEDPQTHDYQPQPLELQDNQSEFDCLSEPYRDPPKYLPAELSSAVINGLSLAYTPSISADQRAIVFTPITLKRADYPANAIPPSPAPTAAKELPTAKVAVPDGGTLLIDGGPVKAKPSETTPSRRMLVLLQPQLTAREGKGSLASSSSGKAAAN